MYIIKNGRIHVGDGTVMEKGDILIDGTKIQKVAPVIECEEAEAVSYTHLTLPTNSRV